MARSTTPTTPRAVEPGEGRSAASVAEHASISTAVREAWEESQRNVAWRDAHEADLERRYSGYWLCVAEQRVVAADTDPGRFAEQVRAGRWRKPGQYLFYLPTAEELRALHVPVSRSAQPERHQ
jgi:hypothetical protein